MGSGPGRGRSPVEWGDFPSVRPSVRPPMSQPIGPQTWLGGPQTWLGGYWEAWEAYEALAWGVRTDKYPLHSTGHRPFGAAAQKGYSVVDPNFYIF